MRFTVTLNKARLAAEWGDGFCLECGEESQSLSGLQAVYRCEECGMVAVVEAERLLAIAGMLNDSEGE